MQKLILAAILFAVSLFTFGDIRNHDFAWEDQQNITENTLINTPSRKSLKKIWSLEDNSHISPVTQTYFLALARASKPSAAEAEIISVSPKLYHSFSVGIHTVNAILVFLILCFIVKSHTTAFIGALLFTLHPIQVESISLISASSVLIGTFFGLVSMLSYMNYTKRQESSSRHPKSLRYPYYIASVSYLLASITLPYLVVLPFVIMLLEKLLPSENSFFQPKKPLFPLVLWLIIGIPYFLWFASNQKTLDLAINFWDKPTIAASTFSFYLYKIFVPYQIGPDYGLSVTQILDVWWSHTLILALLLVAFFLMFWRSKLRTWIAAGLGIFTIIMLPYLGFFTMDFQSTSTVADRHAYLGLFGLSVILALVLNHSKKMLPGFVSLLAVIGLGFLSVQQNSHWKNNTTLWEYALEINPTSPIAHEILAERYKLEGNLAKAKKHYEMVLKTNATDPEIMLFLAEISVQNEELEKAEQLLLNTLKIKPNSHEAYNLIGELKFQDEAYDEALENFSKALKIETNNGAILTNMGKTQIKLKLFDHAVESLKQAIKIDSETSGQPDPTSQALLGYAMFKTGQKEMGQIHLETALQQNSKLPQANLTLADILYEKEDLSGALPKYLKSLEHFRNNKHILFRIGSIYNEQKEFGLAIEYFTKVTDLDANNDKAYTKLAVAQFNTKKFDDAKDNFNKALAINSENADANYYLGDMQRWVGQTATSLTYYYKAIKIDEDHSLSHYRLGNYFSSQNKLSQAIYHYNRALKKDPKNSLVISNLSKAKKAKEQL